MLGGCAMNNGANIAMPATADASDTFHFLNIPSDWNQYIVLQRLLVPYHKISIARNALFLEQIV